MHAIYPMIVSTYKLVGKGHHRRQREAVSARKQQVFQARSQSFDYHDLVSALLARPVEFWDSEAAL
ncbi:MAG: hypothetical protein P4M11_07660 [Candidatus Pacebacteria bacterium]|nr:hypothetical protein [Candidatus Paceibacterota bacterium]